MKITALLVLATIAILVINYFIAEPRRPQCYGLYLGQDISADQINTVSKTYGQKPCVILTFVGWSDRPFKTILPILNSIKEAGAIPMITLEPWLFPSKIPVAIDEKTLKEFGAILKKHNGPVFLRFAHEMNGDWYPWGGYKNKKQPAKYVNSWHKVHEAITKYSGNAKISWVWSINVEDVPCETWNEPNNYYPGDNYVDIIGIDGYNRDNDNRDFENIFKKQIKYVRKNFKGKTIVISEIASATVGVDRPGWIRNFFYKFSRKYSYIPIFIWFDINKEAEWNLSADRASVDAFRTGLKDLVPKDPKTLLEENKK